VAKALEANVPVVALESTVIAHGLPRPRNLTTAKALETEIRALGVVPATIALHDGVAVVGAGDVLLERLANEAGVAKVSIPVLGYGTDEFPAFYVRSSGLRLQYRVNDALGAARIAREQLARGAGMLLCVPVAAESALGRDEVEEQVRNAIAASDRDGIRGADLTPYLLRALGEATNYRALDA